MAYCKECGTELGDTAVHFCPSCGAPLDPPGAPEVSAQPALAQPALAQPALAQPALAQPQSTGPKAPRLSRRLKLWLIWGGVGLVVAVGLALGLFFGLRGSDETPATAAEAASGPAEVKVIDLGVAEFLDSDPELVVYTEDYGAGPADQVLLLMAEGSGRAEAEAAAAQIGGTVVGEVEYIQLYQVVTSGTTAEDLVADIETAAAQPGVEGAFPNAIVSLSIVEGKKCSPLRDPLYDLEGNAIPYEMIGLQRAWDIVRASGIELNNVHMGMVDSSIYTDSGRGFSNELYFPDAKGTYPEGKARVSPLSVADITDTGDLTHGTEVAHMMVADAEGSGVVGVLGPYGGKVTLTTGNVTSGPGGYRVPHPDPSDVTQYDGFLINTLVVLKQEVEAGATVINMSIGSTRPEASNAWYAAAYTRFFEQMQKDHPKVLFVAAAGNENGALDGTNYGPGGLRLPNVITVGALDQTGDRAKPSDWYTTEENLRVFQQWYDEEQANGTLPAGETLERYVDRVVTGGSNYATGNGEVTLSVCGTQVPVGVGTDGSAVLSNGTSFAAPQVTAAAALLKSVDPTLTAQQIKQIMVDTMDTEVVQPDGTSMKVPAEVGGGVLRLDRAVTALINQMAPPDEQVSKDDLDSLMEVILDWANLSLTAEGGPDEYTVVANAGYVYAEDTELTLDLSGEGAFGGLSTQYLNESGQVTWPVTVIKGPVTLRVVRSDTNGCAVLTIGGGEEIGGGEQPAGEIDLSGEWTGTYTCTGEVATMLGELIDPAEAAYLAAGLPAIVDITTNDQRHWNVHLDVDATGFPSSDWSFFDSDLPFTCTYEGDTITVLLDPEWARNHTLAVSVQGESLVMDIVRTGESLYWVDGQEDSVTGTYTETWTLTKPR